jgi:hypothetical protein
MTRVFLAGASGAAGYQVSGTTRSPEKAQQLRRDSIRHVDVAAAAALVAIEKGEPGIFSVVDWAPYLRR